jgi:hypothetical protein
LVFTEGEKTEPGYLLHWYRRNRERVIVTVSGFHGAPLPLVRTAVSRQRADRRDQRRGRGDAYDEYWCVFDVDQHPSLQAAVELARTHGISIAVSNPCIEVWFLLHFTDQRAAIDRREAQRRSRDLLQSGKVLDSAALEQLVAGHCAARARAQDLDRKHEGDGSPPQSNPSSSVWRIVDAIRTPAK